MSSTLVGEKSNRRCEVFDFDFSKTEKHNNADVLNTFSIPGTSYTYVLNINDWKDYSGKVAWINPDTLVNTTLPQFDNFMAEAKYDKDSYTNTGGVYYKVKARKVRGIVSYGLLVKISHDLAEKDVWAELDLHHYEPPVNVGEMLNVGGEKVSIGSNDVAVAPEGAYPYYDLDNFQKYSRVFNDNEKVVITQKLHGENQLIVYKNGELHTRSRNYWKKEFSGKPSFTVESLIEKGVEEVRAKELYRTKVENFKPCTNQWWTVLRNTSPLLKFCQEHEGFGIFGENYGSISGYPYDCKQGERKFRAFDIIKPDGQFVDWDEFKELTQAYNIDIVPVISDDFTFNKDELVQLAQTYENKLGKCRYNEGICVRPIKERFDPKLGRVHLKIKSAKFLEKE